VHNTKVVLKDGRVFLSPIELFRPEKGFMTLFGYEEILYFKDILSATTENERIGYGRIGPQDELQKVFFCLEKARQFNWHGFLPKQEWEDNLE